MVMMRLHAQVRNGRLELSEPTDLPEGQVVELVPVAEAGSADDDMDDAERARLHTTLQQSLNELAPGRGIDAQLAVRQLRAK